VRECRNLFAFCRIPCDDRALARIIHDTGFARHPSGETCYRRGGRVGDWHDGLALPERAEFAQGAGDLLLALGYESDPGWYLRPVGQPGQVRPAADASER
jgi:hypothetical protein